MTKKEDRLMVVAVLLDQAFEDGLNVGERSGFEKGYKAAKAEVVSPNV